MKLLNWNFSISLPAKIIFGLALFFLLIVVAKASSSYISFDAPQQKFVIDNNAQINGKISVNTSSDNTILTIGASESATKNIFMPATANTGLIINTDYIINNYTPGFFWTTRNDNATKPKAGIYLKTANNDSQMYFGTSNNYASGITNSAIVIDKGGDVGIGGVPASSYNLDVQSASARIGSSSQGLLYLGRYYIGDDGSGYDLQTNAPNLYVDCDSGTCKKLLRSGDSDGVGSIGDAGPDGAKGPRGIRGLPGAKGPRGDPGANGSNGICTAGLQGSDGDYTQATRYWTSSTGGTGYSFDPPYRYLIMQTDGNLVIYECTPWHAGSNKCPNNGACTLCVDKWAHGL